VTLVGLTVRGASGSIGGMERERAFSQPLSTEETVPAWRKCSLVFTAERICRVDEVAPWPGFRLEAPEALPRTLRPGESLRVRLANETGIAHMGGAVVVGAYFLAGEVK